MGTLLELLRVTPGSGETVRATMARMDQNEFVAKCIRHGLSGLAQHELRRGGIVLDLKSATTLKRDAMSIAVMGIRVKKLLFQAIEALARHGIVPVLLKGYGLASRCYPDPLYRPMSDVDLLVGSEQMEAAEAALVEIGLKKNSDLEEYQLRHHHHLNFYGTLGAVELHFRAISGFGGAIEGAPLLSRAIECDLEGHRIRYLRPEDELAYLATHATQHLFKGVGWLYDLKLFIRRYPDLDWSAVIESARESGVQTPAYFALWTASRAMDAPVPDWVLGKMRPPRWQTWLGHFIFADQRLVDTSFAELRYSWMVAPFLTSDLSRFARASLFLAWRAPLRKVARHFPRMAPAHWRT